MDSALTEILKSLAEATGVAIDSIKINSTTREMRSGQPIWVKRRKPGSELVAVSANVFFRLTRARIHVWVSPEKWQQWEVSCFHLLYGHGFRAFAEGSRAVCADKVPGASVLPHLNNVIYDKADGRARLIDFEAAHLKSLPAIVRHADDLLVFLQDMAGWVSADQWLAFALCFINAYDWPEVVAELRKHLIVPGGLPALWWKLRSHYLDRKKLIRRFGALERALVALR